MHKQHQTCMYQSKTVVTIKKCKHKNRNARTQTKMHDKRKSTQNGKPEQLENLNLRTKKSLENTKCVQKWKAWEQFQNQTLNNGGTKTKKKETKPRKEKSETMCKDRVRISLFLNDRECKQKLE